MGSRRESFLKSAEDDIPDRRQFAAQVVEEPVCTLERLFDDRAPFKWALLHAITTLAVRRAVHRQSVDLFAMRNPADLRLKAMMA